MWSLRLLFHQRIKITRSNHETELSPYSGTLTNTDNLILTTPRSLPSSYGGLNILKCVVLFICLGSFKARLCLLKRFQNGSLRAFCFVCTTFLEPLINEKHSFVVKYTLLGRSAVLVQKECPFLLPPLLFFTLRDLILRQPCCFCFL